MEARMKAIRDFAMADPDDCDREWAAYLALVSNHETVSDSAPTNSTSSLASAAATEVSSAATASACPRVPRNAATIVNPTATAASRAVLSAEHDSSKDDLTPGARRIYDFLVGGSAAPASSMSLRTLSSAVPTGDHEPAAATSTPASPLDVWRAHSTSDAISTRAASATCVLRVIPLDFTPTLVSAWTTAPEWNLHSLAPSTCSTICLAGDKSADLTASAPTTCLAELPSHDASVYTASLIPSSAEPTLSTTIACVSEQCCFDPEPVVAILNPTSALDLLEGSDDFISMSPSICLNLSPSGGTGTMGSEACSINLVLSPRASTSSLTPATYLVEDVNISKYRGDMFLAWHPPSYVRSQEGNMCKDTLQSLRLDGLVLQSMQLMLWAGKYRWPPPTPNKSTACRYFNLHSTLDDMQLSGKCQVLKAWKLKCSAVPMVVTVVPGVQKTEPKPTLFKWCLHDDLGRSAGSFVLHWPSLPDGNKMHQLTMAETIWFKIFCSGETGDRSQYELLHQWRPPDQVTSLTCMGVLFLGFKNCWSVIHWLQSTIALFDYLLLYERQSTEYWEVHNLLCRLTRSQFPAELFVLEHWFIPWGPGNDRPDDDNLLAAHYLLCITCVSDFRLKPPWLHFAPTVSTAVTSALLKMQPVGDRCKVYAAFLLSWEVTTTIDNVPPMEYSSGIFRSALQQLEVHSYFAVVLLLLGSRLSQEEDSLLCTEHPDEDPDDTHTLIASTRVDMRLELLLARRATCNLWTWYYLHNLYCCPGSNISAIPDWLLILSLETGLLLITKLHTLHAARLYWLLGLECSCEQFVTEGATYFDTQYFEWHIPWYNCDREFLEVFPLSAHPPSKTLHLPWDPGDCFASAWSQDNFGRVDGVSFPPLLDTSQVPWDPGGLSRDRLGDKPNYKEGGLSTTYLHGLAGGLLPWALACFDTRREAYIEVEGPQWKEAWNRTERRLRPRLG